VLRTRSGEGSDGRFNRRLKGTLSFLSTELEERGRSLSTTTVAVEERAAGRPTAVDNDVEETSCGGEGEERE
jgi:hypothetical protein